jgi:hypothetical protein
MDALGPAAAFSPPVSVMMLPATLLARFRGDEEARLVALLRFLGPITGGIAGEQAR